MSIAVGRAAKEQALDSLDRLPPFSAVLSRLLASLDNEDVSFSELADVIEKNSVMTGYILRLANAPIYPFRGTVNSVRHAVAILGTKKLRNIMLSLSITRLWQRAGVPACYASGVFDLHSITTAVLSDLFAQQVAVPYSEGAFAAGLLHDFGKLLIGIALPLEFGIIRSRYECSSASMEECESGVIGTTHAILSAEALRKWNLPEPIQTAVLCHHSPALTNQGELSLAHLVQAADQLAIDLGHPAIESARKPEPAAAQYIETLGLTDHMPEILAQLKPELEIIKGSL